MSCESHWEENVSLADENKWGPRFPSLRTALDVFLGGKRRPEIRLLFAGCPFAPGLLHTNVKDKDKPEDRQEAVLRIKCCDCQATYIGETRRNLSTRLTEHKRATKNGDVNNHIADHHLQTKHRSNRLGRCDMYYVFSDYYQRPTLESWFTNWEQTSLNRSQQLPAPYKRLYWRTQAKLITREWLDNRQFD